MIVAQIKFIAAFLTILEGQKKQMLSRVDQHMAKVFETGHDWMENKLDQPMSFREITSYLNNVFDLIGDTSQRFNFSDITQESTTSGHLSSQTVASAIKHPEDEVDDVTQGSFPSGLDAKPLPGHVNPKPVATEIKPVDEFGDEIEKDSTSDLDVQSLPDHSFSQHEEKEIKPMVDEETMEMILATIDNLQKTFSSLQTAIFIVSDIQEAVEQRVDLRIDQMSIIAEQHMRRVADIEKQVEKLYKEQKEEDSKLNTKLEKLERNITQLTDSYMKRIEDQVKETNKTVEEMTSETALKLLNLDNGLKSEERRRQKVVERFEKIIMETENKVKMVNYNFGQKMTDAENRLVQIALQKDENITMLADEFDEIVSRIDHVETVCTPKQIGFTAKLSYGHSAKPYSVIKGFDVYSNSGGHFNSTSGIFTAPVDGVYVMFLGMQLRGRHIDVSVQHSQNGKDVDGKGNDVCRLYLRGHGTRLSCLDVVEMKAGEKVYLWTNTFEGLADLTTFSGFYIN